jgi:riboflavin synthase alpha subunit
MKYASLVQTDMGNNGHVRLNLSARINQPFNSVFLSQQISISVNISRFYSQPNRANTNMLLSQIVSVEYMKYTIMKGSIKMDI